MTTVPPVDDQRGRSLEESAQVTVVVVTWEGAHLLPPCLDSLRSQTLPHRVVVVDNASTDGTAELLAARPDVDVVRAPRNLGFAGGAQLGIDAADSEFVALLNNDAVADPRWLEELVAAARAHPDAAAVTALMLLAGQETPVVNNAGVVLLDTWYGADRGLGESPADVGGPCEVFGFSGGAALLRSSAVRGVGGFATEFFLYYEDTELSWRLRDAGWTIRFQPTAVVVHEHSATVDQRSRSFAYYNERNRLWTLFRRAPMRVALAALARFLVTTASLTVRPAPGGEAGVPWNLRPRLRLAVARDVLRYLPTAVRHRRRGGSRGTAQAALRQPHPHQEGPDPRR
jgi:GT2 family glycosyltransferase